MGRCVWTGNLDNEEALARGGFAPEKNNVINVWKLKVIRSRAFKPKPLDMNANNSITFYYI